MATARDFITLAMKEAGVLGVGQTLLAEDINDGFTLLNRMLAQWQKKRWLVPSLYEIAAVGNSQKSNLIGPGQYYNAQRPDKIQTAYFKQVGGAFSSAFSSSFSISMGGSEVSYPLIPIWSWEDYALIQLKELNSWPQYFFYDGAYPYGNVYIWPIPTSSYEVHLVCKSPIGFTVQLESGRITNSGSNYVDGAYANIPFVAVTGFGNGGTADVTVLGGIVTNIVINAAGDGYKINDDLTLDTTLMGAVGSGLVWNVTQVTDSLDAEFNMPEEYHEAVHYNLCIRLCSMYQAPINQVQAALAKLSLNTIKIANVQIPTLKMPSALRFGRGGNNFYIFQPTLGDY
jgi:hypothetical protein